MSWTWYSAPYCCIIHHRGHRGWERFLRCRTAIYKIAEHSGFYGEVPVTDRTQRASIFLVETTRNTHFPIFHERNFFLGGGIALPVVIGGFAAHVAHKFLTSFHDCVVLLRITALHSWNNKNDLCYHTLLYLSSLGDWEIAPIGIINYVRVFIPIRYSAFVC